MNFIVSDQIENISSLENFSSISSKFHKKLIIIFGLFCWHHCCNSTSRSQWIFTGCSWIILEIPLHLFGVNLKNISYVATKLIFDFRCLVIYHSLPYNFVVNWPCWTRHWVNLSTNHFRSNNSKIKINPIRGISNFASPVQAFYRLIENNWRQLCIPWQGKK